MYQGCLRDDLWVMATHDYLVLRLHEARAADFEAEARQRRLVQEATRAKRMLARLTDSSVLSLRRRPSTQSGGEQANTSEAA